MTATDRATLLAWDRAVRAYQTDPREWLTYLNLSLECSRAGLASPLSVAFGGRA